MKKLTAIVCTLLLVGALAVPVLAWGPGSGWGRHHMMGYRGDGPGYGRGYSENLTAEQRSRLDSLDRKFYNETEDLRDQIWTKSRELDSVLSTSDPDLEKAKALQREINELSAKLDEKTLQYEVETRKIAPDQPGYGYGGGYAPHMRGYNRGSGYAGYCWN